MYDFCFTYPYAILLAIGGLMGYALKGSAMSLMGGVGSGAALYLLAHFSLRHYRTGKLWKTGTVLSLLISAALTAVMFMRYNETGKIFPAGLTMALSGTMSCFYVWSIFLGPEPKKK